MFYRLFVLFAALFYCNSLFSQNIAAARTQAVGSTVTVRGIVTNGSELGKIRYLQDATAGIAAFPGTGSAGGFDAAVKLGDSIQVTGVLFDYQGLLEITPITSYTIISTGNTVPSPIPVSIAGLGESMESRLVDVSCVTFAAAGGTFGSGNYPFSDGSGTSVDAYIRPGSPISGTTIPSGPLHLVGIVSQFYDYQLLPRTASDLNNAPCFYFVQQPAQSNLQQNSFTLSWSTNLSATAVLHYGTTPALGQQITVNGNATQHSATLSNLQAGAIYYAQVAATYNGATTYSQILPFATVSNSSGAIKVFFNHDIAAGENLPVSPDGLSFDAVLNETLLRISQAQQTIDVAMYNTNRTDIVNALKARAAAGVRVRFIAAASEDNLALQPPPGFPVVYGNADAFMHNKFMVIDAGLSDKAWIMNGSMNWTTGDMIYDYNNTLFIQDQSLARTYELEFNEMWGSTGAQPNPANAHFGAGKTNNTPHRFLIGNRPVEAWFSPSDAVTGQIQATVTSAGSELAFAMFAFTKNELGQAVVGRKNAGVAVRGMIENADDPGVQMPYLLANGVQVYAHTLPYYLHHKYAVGDAHYPDSDPFVVTGSHNWTVAAETANDENTLVIHDYAIARMYQAEFNRRWSETVCTLDASVSAVQVSCAGAADGSASVAVNGANGAVSYQWSSGAQGATISNLGPGAYTVNVQDSLGCIASLSVQITEPYPLGALISDTDETAVGAADGTAAVAATGGTPPYAYAWSNGAASAAISGLAPGVYSVAVSDSHGCSIQTATAVNAFNCTLALALSSSNVACAGLSTGTASTQISGGTAPFTYAWNTGETTPNINQLPGGLYSVSVTDHNGCNAVGSVEIQEPSALQADLVQTIQPLCPGDTTGLIQITALGGTPPYLYVWSDGASGNIRTNLGEGVYHASVTDSHNCTALLAASISVTDVQAPEIFVNNTVFYIDPNGVAAVNAATLDAWATDNCEAWIEQIQPEIVDCSQLGIVEISITAIDNSGNTATKNIQVTVLDTIQPLVVCPDNISACPYSGPVSFDAPNASDNCSATGNLISGLPSGSVFPAGYTQQVFSYSDAAGNTGTCSFTVEITPQVEINALSALDDQDDQGIGAIDVAVTGEGPFTFTWLKDGNPVGVTEDISGLHQGTYILQVTDANTCVFTSLAFEVHNYTGTLAADSGAILEIFPNPASETLRVRIPDELSVNEITVMDITGRPLLVHPLEQQVLVTLDISTLPPGAYCLKFKGNAHSNCLMFLIQR